MVSSLSSSSLLPIQTLGLGQAATTSNNVSTASNTSSTVAKGTVYNPGIDHSMIMQLVGKMLEMMMMLLTQKLGSSADAGNKASTYPATSTSTSTADSSKYDPDAAGYASAAASKTTVAPYGYSASVPVTNKTVTTAAPVLSAPKAVVASPAPAPAPAAATTAAAPKTQSNEELAKILGRA